MTSDATLSLEDFQAILSSNLLTTYGDYDTLIGTYTDGIGALDLTAPSEAAADSIVVENAYRIGSNFLVEDADTALTDTAADIGAYAGGHFLQSTSAAAQNVIGQLGEMSAGDTIGERIASWVSSNWAPTAAVAAEDAANLGVFMSTHASDIAVASAIGHVIDANNPFEAGIKEALVLGAGTLVMAAVVPEIGATLGAYAFGSVLAGITSAAVSASWDGIASIINDGLESDEDHAAIAAAAKAAFEDQFNAIMNSSGSTATDNLSGINDQVLTNADALGDMGKDLGVPPPLMPDPISAAKDTFGEGEAQISPLVIDLSSGHTGITLTEFDAATTTTFFDMGGTGFANQTAWVSGDTGLLAMDLNSNGKIDSVNELFGSSTVDGFAKLAALDSNGDLKIDHNDADWSSLVVWADTNGDGVTQDGELHTLDSLGIKSIDLAGVAPSTDTIDGNPISHTSTVTFDDGSTTAIADAWFVNDPTNSYYNGNYTLDSDTLFLPDLRGYGTLPDLTIAMSEDSTLKGMVSDFADSFSLASFADPSAIDSDVTNILYQWAGVEGVDPESRGTVNAQGLEFLEHLFGEAFSQGGNNFAQAGAGGVEDQDFQQIVVDFKTDLLVQTGAQDLFDAPVAYNPWTGTIDGTMHLSESAVGDLAGVMPGTDADAQTAWIGVAQFIDNTEGISNLDGSEHDWLDSAVTSTTSVGWDDIVTMFYSAESAVDFSGTSGDDTLYGNVLPNDIYGYDGNDIIHADAGNDVVYGGAGNDTIYGDAGDDTLYGGDGNDVIYGGDGNDIIYGGAGNDEIHGDGGGNFLYDQDGGDTTYVFGRGQDYITDEGGTDRIVLPSGIDAGDLTITRVSSEGSTEYFNDLLITVAGGGSIQVQDHFFSSGYYQVETLVFSDSSTLDLTALTGYETHLTSGDDTYSPGLNTDQIVRGFDGNDYIVTGSGNDILDGGNGSDMLYGGDGNDIYVASPGFDTISDTSGTDTINIAAGYSLSDVTFSRHIGTYGPDNDLIINIHGLGEIQVANQFYMSTYAVEYLHFLGDDSTVSLTDQTIQTIGTAGDDTLYGITSDVAGNWFDGRGGNDTIINGIGDNTYVFSAGFGTDTVSQPYNAGTNTLQFVDIDPAHIRMWTDYTGSLHLQDTTDTYHSITVSAAVTGNGTAESAIGDYLQEITFNDGGHTVWDLTGGLALTGDNSGDNLFGTAHGDTITGGGGDDYLYGNGGNDILAGGEGNDNLYGGTGDDTYVFASGFGNSNVSENTSEGTDTIHFTGIDSADIRMWTDFSGNLHLQDTSDGSHNITVYASVTGNDTCESTVGQYVEQITFDDESNTVWDLTGGLNITGDNSGGYLFGTAYNDTITGGSSSDLLYGNHGDDILYGAGGSDYLTGGEGADTFEFKGATAFTASATITDFNTSDGDKIDISNILDGHYNPGTDSIANFVHIDTSGSDSILSVDVDGTGGTYSMAAIATISGVTGLDVATLISNGNLVVS